MSLLFHEENEEQKDQQDHQAVEGKIDRSKTFETEEKYNCHTGLPDSFYDRLELFLNEEMMVYGS